MYYILYLSTASPNLSEDDLIDILVQSRRRNIESNITGMLLYAEGSILQVIEGEENDVLRLYNKIELDKRHRDIVRVHEGEVSERNFSGWAMGFKSSSYKELEGYTGYKVLSRDAFLTTEQEGSEHPAMKVLKIFYENYKNS